VPLRSVRFVLAAWATSFAWSGSASGQAPRESEAAKPAPDPDPAPRFQVTLGAGYSGSTADGVTQGAVLGVSALYRLSNTRGSTVGIPLLVAVPISGRAGAYMTGVQLGHTLYLRGLVGFVSGVTCSEWAGSTCVTPAEQADLRLGIGGAVGVHVQFGKVVGLDAQAFLAKGFGLEGASAGIIAGPTLQFGAADSDSRAFASDQRPSDRGSHFDLAVLHSRIFGFDDTESANAFGARAAYVHHWGSGFGLDLGARLVAGVGGFDVALQYRFDRFTGPVFAPYVSLGPALLFGISRGDLFSPPDLSIGLGAGVDFPLTRGSRLGPSVRFYHPLLTGESYTGPLDVSVVLSFDL
jgi:hypothetical protein